MVVNYNHESFSLDEQTKLEFLKANYCSFDDEKINIDIIINKLMEVQ